MIVNLADLADSMNKQNLYHQQDHWPPAKKSRYAWGASTRASRHVTVHGPFKPMPASSTLERSLAFELTPSGFHAICCCGAD